MSRCEPGPRRKAQPRLRPPTIPGKASLAAWISAAGERAGPTPEESSRMRQDWPGTGLEIHDGPRRPPASGGSGRHSCPFGHEPVAASPAPWSGSPDGQDRPRASCAAGGYARLVLQTLGILRTPGGGQDGMMGAHTAGVSGEVGEELNFCSRTASPRPRCVPWAGAGGSRFVDLRSQSGEDAAAGVRKPLNYRPLGP